MRIIGLKKLHDFCLGHGDCRSWINNWLCDARNADWASPHDVLGRYPTASVIGNGTIIFNVRGNIYRLETQIAYRTQTILILWVGTHAEYTKRYK